MEKELAKKVLLEALKTGGDFAELFFEDTTRNSIRLTSGSVENVTTSQCYGVGLRILYGTEELYGNTNELTEESLMNFARDLASGFNYKQTITDFDFTDTYVDVKTKIDLLSKTLENSKKLEYLKIASNSCMNYDKRIVQTLCFLTDSTQNITVFNSNGVMKSDVRNVERITIQAIAKDDKGNMQRGSTQYGGNFGYTSFKGVDWEEFGLHAARQAVNMLDADLMEGGVYDVVMDNAFGGVIFHEACGHSLEATSVARGLSVFTNKLGQKIASDVVTAIDDGTIPNEWGSANIDDEGNETKKNVLIENGVLKSYMIDYRNSRRMKMDITGSGRRESYKYSPTSRMTNTYIANGNSTLEEIIANTKYGLYAKEMGGGSVNPTTGEFNFSVLEGYMIEDGKITKPVKGATLIGNGKDTLLHIDMVANNQSFGYGICGSSSGSIPACVGQPAIRIKQMTVGGAGGRK